jgi:hypothetical protein
MENLKLCGKILPISLQQRIMPKDSTEAANLGCYAERFCLSTQYGILGGNFPSNNSYLACTSGCGSGLEVIC